MLRETGLASKVSPSISVSAEWKNLIDKLKRYSKRRIMVVGPPDSGKSSFCKAVADNIPFTAIVDMDPGQQNVAIPGAVGAEVRGSFGLKKFMFFVGRNSPRGIGGLICFSLRSLLLAVERFNPRVILLDTSGYVDGDEALILKLTKAFIFRPTDIVFIEDDSKRTSKIKTVLGSYFRSHLLPRSEFACQFAPEDRAEIRNKRISEYFSCGQIFRVKKDESRIIDVSNKLTADDSEFKNLVGFFKNGLTIAVGLIKSESHNEFEILSPRFPKEWDFAIKGSMKIKLDSV